MSYFKFNNKNYLILFSFLFWFLPHHQIHAQQSCRQIFETNTKSLINKSLKSSENIELKEYLQIVSSLNGSADLKLGDPFYYHSNMVNDNVWELGRRLILSESLKIKNPKGKISLQKDIPFQVQNRNVGINLLVQSALKHGALDADVAQLFDRRKLSLQELNGKNQDKVVIIGGGPLGLIGAIEAYARGRNVVLIESRNQYSREQIVGFDADFINWLRNNAPELDRLMQAFELFVPRSGWHDLKLNGEQDTPFYSARLQQLENSLALLIHLIHKNDSDSISIQYNETVSAVDTDSSNGAIILTNKKDDDTVSKNKYLADIVLGTDGASGRSKFLFGLNNLTGSTEHWAGTGIFEADPMTAYKFNRKWDARNVREIYANLSKKQQQTVLKKLAKLGWEKNTLPAIRIFQNGNIFYLGAEVPQSKGLEFSQNREARDRWFEELRDLAFPNIKDLKYIDYGLGGTTTFSVEFRHVDKFVIGNENFVYGAIGDNAAGPHFMTRSGFNTGFKELQLFIDEVMSEPTMKKRGISIIDNSQMTKISKAERVTGFSLLDKASGTHLFQDGPFFRKLNKLEQRIQDQLIDLGFRNISYLQLIKPLIDVGYNPNNKSHLELLKKFRDQLSSEDLISANQEKHILEFFKN